MADSMRLQKYLSRTGRASRREAERLMAAGRVRVNGEVVSEMGARVAPGTDVVEVDGRPVSIPSVRWVLFHKPSGVLTTRSDPHGGRTVYDVLPPDLSGLRYLGRLDRDTEGLLILTNEGDVANALQHPSGEIEREYVAVVEGRVDEAAVGRLLAGIDLDDGPARARAVRVDEARTERSTVTIVLTEGRKREVRRMLYAVGHPVVTLTRVRFGPLSLGPLAVGRWRDLDEAEIRRLREAVGAEG